MDESEPLYGLVFFVIWLAMWLGVTTLLTIASGWRALAKAYADSQEAPRLRVIWQSAAMTGRESPFRLPVSFGNCLSFAVHPSGLRLGLMWLFKPFTRNFMVPWRDIRVERTKAFFGERVVLDLGNLATLRISGRLANKLAAAAGGQWPERRPFAGSIVT